MKHGLKICHLTGALYLRKMTENSLSRNLTAQKVKCHFEVIKRYVDTFRPDELFPDVNWSKIASERRQLHAKCLVAATYLSIGQAQVTANSAPVYPKMAFEKAWSELNECLEMEPNNREIRDLMQKCELGRQRYEQQAHQAVC